jgi:hypothetical protein
VGSFVNRTEQHSKNISKIVYVHSVKFRKLFSSLYQRNLSLHHYHLLFSAKNNLGGQRNNEDCEMETYVMLWPITQDTDFYQQAIEQLVPRCDK